MKGSKNGFSLQVFDYKYTVGGGRSSHTYNQTVAYIKDMKVSLPFFTLGPENFFHKVGSVFGYKDIDFSSHPLFLVPIISCSSLQQIGRYLYL